MIRIPKFQWIDGRTERYEATTDDGARLVVVYNDRWESWFWYIRRKGQTTVAGSAPDLHEAKERAIGAWLSTC